MSECGRAERVREMGVLSRAREGAGGGGGRERSRMCAENAELSVCRKRFL